MTLLILFAITWQEWWCDHCKRRRSTEFSTCKVCGKSKPVDKQLLQQAQRYCDDNDKSTEFMLEYMQKVANCDLDTVLDFLDNQL